MKREEMQSQGHEERINRLERALAELTDALSQRPVPGLRLGSEQALAAILRDRRRGALETTDPAGLEERAL